MMFHRAREAHALFWCTSPWHGNAHRICFRICVICLSLYIAYVAYLAQSPVLNGAMETILSLILFAAVALGAYAALLWLCQRWARLRRNTALQHSARGAFSPRLFALATGLSLAVLLVAFAACFPGAQNYDFQNQLHQALGGEYNNWHPVFHTLLIWLLTRVCDGYWFLVAAQLAAYAIAAGYLTAVLCRYGVPVWLALAVQTLVAGCAPVRNCLMYFGKDSAMTVGVLILFAHSVNMLYTRGEWLRRPMNAIAFGLTLAFVTLVRHNAVLLTVPMLLCALCALKGFRRGVLAAAGVAAAVIALVMGPLYAALDVVYPHNTLEESVGIPMAVMGNVKQQNPEGLDDETKAFLASLASDDAWNTTYRRSNYNAIKFTFPRELIAERSAGEMLGMALRTALANPRIAFETFNEVTSLVWGVSGENRGAIELKVSGGARGSLIALLDAPGALLPLRWLMENIGVQLLALMLAALLGLYSCGTRTLALVLPALIYCLGTMLLLCGEDARFFQFVFACGLPGVIALLGAPCETEA